MEFLTLRHHFAMILIVLLSFVAISASQTHQPPFCSSLRNFYDSMCPTHVERSALVSRQGIPGKRGPIGEKGEQGLKGSTGIKGSAGKANYDRVEEMISGRMDEVLRNQSRKFSELSTALMEAKREIRRLANKSDYCPIKYNEKCFWVEIRYSGITFEKGKQICAAQGGVPANIYSQDHYYMMFGYLRMPASYSGSMQAWLGMTYSTQMNTALLSDGSRAPFVKWFPGYPKSAYCCNIYLEANMDWKSTGQHMVTTPPLNNPRGVICEK